MAMKAWRNKLPINIKDELFPSIAELRDEMDRVFDRVLHNPWFPGAAEGATAERAVWSPAIDVHEEADCVCLAVELPGVNPADIDLSISGNSVTIKGEKRSEAREESPETYKVERRFGSFRRTIELPGAIDEHSVAAEYKNGVLTVRVKKTPETVQRKIPIVETK